MTGFTAATLLRRIEENAGHDEAPSGIPAGLGARSRLGQAANGQPW